MGNQVYVVVLWDTKQPLEVHKFTMDEEGKSHYRAIMSWNYFRNRESGKASKRVPFMFRSHGMTLESFEISASMEARIFAPDPAPILQLPQFDHSSIWDMYKAIGYDYKRKRYIRTER